MTITSLIGFGFNPTFVARLVSFSEKIVSRPFLEQKGIFFKVKVKTRNRERRHLRPFQKNDFDANFGEKKLS